ncbi:acyl-CoA thioesterase, partial [Nocardia brasiliensis]|uniref:acyl-CoA thioesterase n=1 Tax=Nocardia brasiliensis TaxID=37326 RepID=UPI003D7931E3
MTSPLNGHGKAQGGQAVLPKRFHTQVEVRWSDMDAFQHVNHARMVTLLEEARIPWLLEPGRPTAALGTGCVLADLRVRYRGQLRHEDTPLDIAMWIEQLRAVDFTIGYEVRAAAAAPGTPPAGVAWPPIAAGDKEAQRVGRGTGGG